MSQQVIFFTAIASLWKGMSTHCLVGPFGWLVVCWLVRWSVRHAGVAEVMQQIWDGLTANCLCSLYASMRRRMQLVIEAKGGATK